MADYGLKYQCTFDPVAPLSADPVYKVEILQKDYSGDAQNVLGAGVPVRLQWQTDDPIAPVKGSSLSIALINEGSLPLESFYSTESDGFKLRFWYKTQLLFEGFIVQGDSSELMLDFRHEINLSANDNLGLLKQVALNESPISFVPVYKTTDEDYSTTAPNTITISPSLAAHVLAGDKLFIAGLIANLTFNVADVSGSPDITIVEVVTTGGPITADITVLRATLLDKMPLLDILKLCLSATGLELKTRIYCNIYTAEDVWFLNTLVDPQTFLKDDANYDDCYNILTKLMATFGLSLSQDYGVWNIIHWAELRRYNNLIPGFEYDKDFNLLGSVTLDAPFIAGIGEKTYAETGLLKKILDPFQYDKETFNYKQPPQLLRNFNLQTLGPLLRTSTTGSGVDLQNIREYSAPWWFNAVFPGSISDTATYFIRVISDYLDNEIERYLVVVNPSGWSAMSYPVEANAGDRFKFSYQVRTTQSRPGSVNLQTYILLDNGTTHNYFLNGLWNGLNPYITEVPDGDNTNVWHSVDIDTGVARIPFDGLLYFFLDTQTDSGYESQYKDIRLEYTPFINDSTKIIGQTHKNTQTGNIKNNEDVEIFLDSTPRNSISGTLFLPTVTGLLQDRTNLWRLDYPGAEDARLGEIITREKLFWRRKPRTILDGTMYGLTDTDKHISNLSVFKYTALTGLNFVPGTIEIDYKNNHLTGTLWEQWKDGQPHCKSYTFSGFGFPVGAWSITGILCDGTPFSYSSISGDGSIPDDPICAQVGSIETSGNIIVTAGDECGSDPDLAGEADTDLESVYEFKYLYSTK